jgi:hypothetical protein
MSRTCEDLRPGGVVLVRAAEDCQTLVSMPSRRYIKMDIFLELVRVKGSTGYRSMVDGLHRRPLGSYIKSHGWPWTLIMLPSEGLHIDAEVSVVHAVSAVRDGCALQHDRYRYDMGVWVVHACHSL